jgi:hypothetical protein
MRMTFVLGKLLFPRLVQIAENLRRNLLDYEQNRSDLANAAFKPGCYRVASDGGACRKGCGISMIFLLRMAFWLGLVLVLLPSGGGQRRASPREIDAADAIGAASAAVHDLRGFCAREPDACAVGSQLAADAGRRARAGARMLYDLLSGAPKRHEGSSDHGASQSERGGASPPGENTLTPTDLAPAWRGRPPSGHPA